MAKKAAEVGNKVPSSSLEKKTSNSFLDGSTREGSVVHSSPELGSKQHGLGHQGSPVGAVGAVGHQGSPGIIMTQLQLLTETQKKLEQVGDDESSLRIIKQWPWLSRSC